MIDAREAVQCVNASGYGGSLSLRRAFSSRRSIILRDHECMLNWVECHTCLMSSRLQLWRCLGCRPSAACQAWAQGSRRAQSPLDRSRLQSGKPSCRQTSQAVRHTSRQLAGPHQLQAVRCSCAQQTTRAALEAMLAWQPHARTPRTPAYQPCASTWETSAHSMPSFFYTFNFGGELWRATCCVASAQHTGVHPHAREHSIDQEVQCTLQPMQQSATAVPLQLVTKCK